MSSWARLAAVAAAFACLATASRAATPASEPVLLTPQTLAVGFQSPVAPEVEAAQREAAFGLLDRDTTSAYAPLASGTSWVDLDLGAEAHVDGVKVYGPASYWLTVLESTGGQWRMVPGLNNVALDSLGAGWHRLSAGSGGVTTRRLRLEFRPRPVKGARQGLREIEIWGGGRLVPVAGGRHLRDLVDGGEVPPHARVYAATPAEIETGTARTTATVDLPYDPRVVKRAYLAYDAFPVASWVSAARTINGHTLTGGFATLTSTNWVEQVEAIPPAALVAGENVVAFQAGAAGGYRIRNVRLLVELADGANAVVVPARRGAAGGFVPADPLFDDDVLTGVVAPGQTFEWRLDTPTQVEQVRLFLVGALGGQAAWSALREGTWAPVASGGTFSLATLKPGWSAVAMPAGLGPVEGLRLTIPAAGPRDPMGQLAEVRVVGSPVGGPADRRAIHVASPEEGEYYGRQAFLVGWLAPARLGAGAPALFVDGKPAEGFAAGPDGAFSVAVQRDAGPFAGQPDVTPWATTLKAVYPDGVEVVATVPLTVNRLAAPAEDAPDAPGTPAPGAPAVPALTAALPGPRKPDDGVCARQLVLPSSAATLRCKRVFLEVPAGAVAEPVEISIVVLGEADLAHLDPGMINVTGDDAGYRFLPAGLKFRRPVRLGIPYDPRFMPAGADEDSTATFYNESPEDRWHGLKRLTLDARNGMIVSETDHFTDMINATLVLPEHPTPLAYNPTSIKDLKAADPGARINLIEPPTANPMGDARLSYPIEVPPGRQGMHPQLALTYNSSGGNGWVGMGWDLQVSSVSIDTRWGVPRYGRADLGYAGLETETYTLDGEQLAPTARRAPLEPRTSPKVFHTRVEGAFRRIVRRGDGPTTYWWEVTEKDGTRHFYGGRPETGRDAAAVLADPQHGWIFRWMLVETRDPNGNSVTYRYDRVLDSGVGGGQTAVPGVQLYLKEIRYTGHNGTPGAYAVTFHRNGELRPGERRPDVTIDARAGFKVVTAQLLERIDVTYKGQLVRGYTLAYREGAFRKTLLASITQFGTGGPSQVFHTHTFDYYDEITHPQGGYAGFEAGPDWNTGADGIRGNLIAEDNATALNGTPGTSVGGHLYVGINIGRRTKQGSAGFKVGYSRSESEGNLALMDVDGDGLADKVFRKGNSFWYRPNRSGPGGTTTFGDPIPVDLPAISEERSETTTAGAEAYPDGGSVMADVSQTFTTSTAYMADVNADGRVDVVRDGQVFFGYLDPSGTLRYSTDSSLTPAPIPNGAVDPSDLVEDLTSIYEERIDQFPLLDSVRTWEAPFDGVVRITGTVALVADTSPERAAYRTADGVRVAIQQGGVERWATTIAPDDYTPKTPTGVSALPVSRGERLYFRVQSVFDGAYDQVDWNPVVEYVGGGTPPADANGRNPHRYESAADFVLAGRSLPVVMPFDGVVRVTGALLKPAVTTDDVAIEVLRNGTPVLSRSLAWDATGAIPLADDIPVSQQDQIELRIRVDSPIDLTTLQWRPQLFYVSAPPGIPIRDDDGNFIVQLRPPYDADLYPATDLVAPQGVYRAPRAGTLLVTPALEVDPDRIGPTPRRLVFTVKARGGLKAKRSVEIRRTGIPDQPVAVDFGSLPIAVDVEEGDELFFDFSSRDVEIPLVVLGHPTAVRYAGDPAPAPDEPQGTLVPSALHAATTPGVFPQTYRGWAAIGYNGNRDRASRPIDEAALVLREDYRLETARFYLFTGDPETGRWIGPDDLAWVAPGRTSASRLGIDYIQVPRSDDFAGLRAPHRVSRARQLAAGGGIGGASASFASGQSQPVVEFVDLNGDGYPDVLGNGGAQFTEMTGALVAPRRAVPGLGSIRENDNFSATIGYGGSVPQNKADSGGDVTPVTDSAQAGVTGSQGPELPPLGFSGDLSRGTSEALSDLLDVNADGLPDRVFEDGRVALNLGYEFATPEPWGFGFVNEGDSLNVSLGVNAGFNDGIYGFGGGLSLSRNNGESDCSLTDINGDGLLDVVSGSGGTLSVRINTGNGFTDAVAWRGALGRGLADSSTTTQGGGAYFTIPIPIPFTPVVIIINPGGNANRTMARQDSSLRDVNGDGYPDHLVSDSDGRMAVALSRVGRTNLLKSVSRPLGASFVMSYDRSGNTLDHPQSRWVLSRVEVDDGHHGDGVDVLVTTYRYEDGFYDRDEREFYGYRVVTETRADQSQVVEEYHNRDYARKMLLAKSVTKDRDGRLFLKHEVEYDVRPVAGGAEFPARIRTTDTFYEGLTADEASPLRKTTSEEFDYDAFGNVTVLIDRAGDGAADDVHARFTYLPDSPAYLVGLPVSIRVTDTAGRLHRERQARYDDRGNLIRLESTLVGGENPVYTLTYDPFGNLETIRWPNGYTVTYAYDPDVRTHRVRAEDSFGYVSTGKPNLLFGLEAERIDVAGNATTMEYDAFSRLVVVRGPYDLTAAVPTLRMEYDHESRPARAITYQKEHHPLTTTLDVVTAVDGLMRVLQTKKEAEVEQGAGPVYGMTVTGKVIFDEMGRVVQQGQPVFEPGYSVAFSPAVPLRNPTKTTYDILDRTVAVETADGARKTTRYDFEDGLFRTTMTDPEGNVRVSLSDVGDQVVAVDEFLGGARHRTRYAYSILDELVEVVDAKGNRTTAEYDTLGRRVAIDSPDTGRTEYRYDAADNLIAKVTANLRAAGEEIRYLYEFNRLREIRYPETPAVRYEYGPPGAPDNGASRITRITDETGVEERFYGKLGEVVKSIKTIASETGPKPEVYTTESEYDSFARLRRLVYPDGEVLTYTYDRGGNVQSAVGEKRGNRYTYVRHLGYDEFSERVRLVYGNGVETRYAYDPVRRWLVALTTRTPDGQVLQNLRYEHDLVGNVLGSTNTTPITRFGSVTLGPVEHRYRYDDLYRLVEASGRFEFAPGKVNRYTNIFTYDPIHNLRNKIQTHTIDQPSGTAVEQHKTTYSFTFQYNGPRPHALTSDGQRTYQHDANGNVIRWDEIRSGQRRELRWTEENRLREVVDNGRSTRYRYDADGERVIKRGRFGETVWVNQYFTVRNAEVATKHVFAGETRVASQLVRQGGRRPLSRGPADGRQSSAPVAGEPVLVAAVGGAAAPEADEEDDLVAPVRLAQAQPARGTGRPAWAGPHETRGIERALETGRGRKVGLQGRGGEEPPTDPGGGTPGGGVNPGGQGRGRTSPAIEGPYRPQEFQLYFYHGDHLGSSSVITDAYASVYEHVEYFPSGESWVEQGGTATLLPYKFTSKEIEPETGLYYFGARYYDARTSRWQSPDPALHDLLTGDSTGGLGGIYNPKNLSLYAYGHHNPVRLSDPDGNIPLDTIVDVGFVIYDAGRFLGAGAAFVVGAVTNDAALKEVALEGMKETGADLAASGAGLLTPYVPSVVTRGARVGVKALKTGDKAVDTGKAVARTSDAAQTTKAGKAAEAPAPGCPLSFAAGTLVTTPDGLVPIEQLEVGSLVLAAHDETGELGWRRITTVFVERHDEVIELIVAGEDGLAERIVTTARHPFYVVDRGWTEAANLSLGSWIPTWDGDHVQVLGSAVFPGPRLAYNLEVEAFHTYFVGTSGTWVHNSCKHPGRKGGPEHRREVEKVKADIESRELTAREEFRVETPRGEKKARYVDVAALDKKGKPVEFHQVGKANKRGDPVARERRAERDIKAAPGSRGVKFRFHPYNKR